MQGKESLKLSQTVIKASYVGAFRPKGLAARRESPLRGLSVLASFAISSLPTARTVDLNLDLAAARLALPPFLGRQYFLELSRQYHH